MAEPKHHITNVIDLIDELTISQQKYVLGYLMEHLECLQTWQPRAEEEEYTWQPRAEK